MKTFTLVHVIISLLGIASGFVVFAGLLGGMPSAAITAFFLITMILTSVTGFFFPFEKLLPSHIVGIISLVVLALACWALYGADLSGGWRTTYIVSVVLAQYFNFFVLVVQSFLKVPSLHALAPQQNEPVFKVTQALVFIAFALFGTWAVMS
jgi:hypothetical protein